MIPICRSYLNWYHKLETHNYRMSLCAVILRFLSLDLIALNLIEHIGDAVHKAKHMKTFC